VTMASTTATVDTVALLSPRGTRTAIRQTVAMAKRSTKEIFRQPALVAPSMVFPIFFAALGASSFSGATNLPGFPEVDSFLQFSLAATIVQGVLFGSVTGAAAMATDIQNGFFDRLLLAPTTRTGILIGRLAGSAIFGAFQAAFFIAVLWPFGATIRSGVGGAAIMVASGGIVALAIGALMSAVAIKTGSAEAVQGSFPLLFVLLFFSSAFFPRETMTGLYRRIADVNPVSYLVEGLRELVLVGFSFSALARAILIPALICVFAVLVALGQLRRRLAAR
jgi:ABC-2 type transport system permease protein